MVAKRKIHTPPSLRALAASSLSLRRTAVGLLGSGAVLVFDGCEHPARLDQDVRLKIETDGTHIRREEAGKASHGMKRLLDSRLTVE